MGIFDKKQHAGEKGPEPELPAYEHDQSLDVEDGLFENADQLRRRLGNRQIQLIAIGGSIGTALFGPGSLFLAYLIYSCMLALVNNCMAEMTILMPVSGGFIRMAGHWVDDALGFMAGWNFFFYEALLIPFEITALNSVLGFGKLINVLAVRAYGEAEFWLSGGKVVLIFLLFSFTFITMVGGNPQHDAYGFRYWNKPGAFAEYITTGSLGKFEGFLAALWSASFTVVGPEYISMVAAEAKRPRIYIKNAFKTVYWRFGIFFIMGALAVGIVIPYNDKTLVGILAGKTGGAGTAAASPYVIAMQNLGIGVLPHIVNALMVTSIFSAGNTYTYCATRSLYGLALESRAPRFLRKCTNNGVPIFCFVIVMIFPFLSFLSVSSSSNVVLTWLVSLITAGGIIDYIVMTTTYIFFYRALKAQGIDRKTLPYCGWFQPYSAYIGLAWMFTIVCTFGYSSYLPWSVSNFFINYTMLLLAPVLFIGWKVIHRTKFVGPLQADLVWERPTVDAYEATFLEPPVGFWSEMLDLCTFGKLHKGRDRRASSVAQM
ncbi:hypothetical protein B0A55_00184 [Friedmanniomyces simplex]|uniref:Amino acid permease/ SLC12A domain-containing protein n=1 Tax=Friedmanniomyces simplex TaxID=329884 RepID=A0A4U0Y440_9PEZI|nr:hypothetical protein B0A55_00184 [Friedmanniomyces simplex]